MPIAIAAFLVLLAALAAGAPVRANTITLTIAQNGTTTATVDIPAMPNGPDYVLAVLPFELGNRAIITPETDPKDFVFVVSREPRGVLAITGYGGKARFTIRNAVDAIDGERLKIRLAKQDAPYEELKTLESSPGVLVDTAEKAIITWTTQIDLPEKVEDLKPTTLRPVNSRLTLGKAEIGNELIVDMKNPAAEIDAVSTRFGNIIVLISTLLVGLITSYGAWEKAPPWAYGVFLVFVAAATGYAVYRAYVHGWPEGLSTLGGVTGAVTLVFNLVLIGLANVRKRRIASVRGKVTAQGAPVGGVKMSLVNSAEKDIGHATSDHEGNYQITFWNWGSNKQGYTLKAEPDFAESWQNAIELGPGVTVEANVDLRLYDVVGSWDLDEDLTKRAISESLIQSAGGSLGSDEAARIAAGLQAELRYPAWISVQRDNRVQAAERHSGRWQASKDGPSAFELTIAGLPALRLMERSGNELVFRRSKHAVLAAVYALKAKSA